MRVRLVSVCSLMLAVSSMGTPIALGAVDLVLRPHERTVRPGAFVDVDLIAVSDDGTAQEVLTVDAVLIWDSTLLELIEVIDSGPHSWGFFFGLAADGGLDGLNDSLSDGDALFQAVSFSAATASADGLLVGTLRFVALADSPSAQIAMIPELGTYSKTQVFQPGGANVTGQLFGTGVGVVSNALISAADVTLPAGRVSNVVVAGTLLGAETTGVTIVLELVASTEAAGTVSFTAAPPGDVEQLGDPWPDAGSFSVFDSDVTGSTALNGSVDDNGSFELTAVTYDGELSGFPVATSVDAAGAWNIRLCVGSCFDGDASSSWNGIPTPVPTALDHGTLHIVDLGDGDGDGSIELGDFAEFQACYTGAVGPVDPPAFPAAPAMRCGVYDFDDDGDIDAVDFGLFQGAMALSGP